MRKIYLALFVAFLIFSYNSKAQTGTYLVFDIENSTTPLAASSVPSALTGTPTLVFGSGIRTSGNGLGWTNSVGGNGCNGGGYVVDDFITGATLNQANNEYIEIGLKPTPGSFINLSNLDFFCRGNGTRPVDWAVFTSDDNFTTAVSSSNPSSSADDISGSACTSNLMPLNIYTSDTITIRIYFYNAGNGTGNLSIMNIGFNGFGSLLPVKLLAFDLKPGGTQNNLSWKVASESNFSHYNIQRSANGKDFTTIGKIVGSGAADYNFSDVAPGAKNFYRLQMVDKNGITSNSKVLVAANKIGSVAISLQPNMVTSGARLNIAVNQAQNLNVFVTNISGQKTVLGKYSVQAGSSQISLAFDKLTAGAYQLTVLPEHGEQQTVRFVKQ